MLWINDMVFFSQLVVQPAGQQVGRHSSWLALRPVCWLAGWLDIHAVHGYPRMQIHGYSWIFVNGSPFTDTLAGFIGRLFPQPKTGAFAPWPDFAIPCDGLSSVLRSTRAARVTTSKHLRGGRRAATHSGKAESVCASLGCTTKEVDSRAQAENSCLTTHP